MKYKDNNLYTNGQELSFSHRIEKVLETKDTLIVLLDIDPLDEDSYNNVYGVKQGNIVWQVEDAHNVFTESEISYSYTLAKKVDDDKILLTDFNGIQIMVDSNTGKIIPEAQ